MRACIKNQRAYKYTISVRIRSLYVASKIVFKNPSVRIYYNEKMLFPRTAANCATREFYSRLPFKAIKWKIDNIVLLPIILCDDFFLHMHIAYIQLQARTVGISLRQMTFVI